MAKTDQAYEALKRDILAGILVPDEPLTVSALKDRYGFGWTPLRDSLSRLEGENLVTLVRNRGYRVAGASYGELLDILKARLVIEVELLRESIRHGDDEWQKRTLLSHRNLSRAPELRRGMSESDYSQWETAHRDFHLELVSASGQLWLGRFLVQLHAQVCRHQRLIVMGKRPPGRPPRGRGAWGDASVDCWA